MGKRRLKTHCIHGHELSAENVLIEKAGDGSVSRRCRTCKREKERHRPKAYRERVLARQRTPEYRAKETGWRQRRQGWDGKCECGAPAAPRSRSRRCRECGKAHRRAHRLEYRARYYQANAEGTKRKAREWRLANPERAKAKRARYYAENAEEAKRRVKEWRKAHPEAKSEAEHRRRARKLSCVGSVSAGIRKILAKRQRNRCIACGADLRQSGSHLDHIIPLARGGPHDDANLQLLCPSCNTRKRADDPVVFMQRMGFLL